MVQCCRCPARGIIRRPKTGQPICKECFFAVFEEEIHQTIITAGIFRPGERIAIAASGGKDSTVLAYVIKLLNDRHGYGLDLILLSIDEGITGYRDDSLTTVHRNSQQYGLPLKVISYAELYGGWTMDKIVALIGKRNNCTYCGVLRRQALDRGAALLGVSQILTGHNADDMAETVLMNLFRGDVARLRRCTDITTGFIPSEGTACGMETGNHSTFITTSGGGAEGEESVARVVRSKPFKYAFEKEIVMYAYFRKLDYFSTECVYAPNAFRGQIRSFIKDLEAIRPQSIIDIIYSGEAFEVKEQIRCKTQTNCERCGYIASNKLCKACVLLEGLETMLRERDTNSTLIDQNSTAAIGSSMNYHGDDSQKIKSPLGSIELQVKSSCLKSTLSEINSTK